MNLKEIAAALNVSPASVSIVRNGQPGVSAATRRRIQVALEQNGYAYEPYAMRTFRDSSSRPGTHTIRLICFSRSGLLSHKNEGFVDGIIDAVDARSRAGGYMLTVSSIHDTQLDDSIKTLSADPCMGVIIIATEMERSDIERLKGISKPLVLMDTDWQDLPFSSVSMDNRAIGYQAVKLLSNCNTLGYVRSAQRTGNLVARECGYREALLERGIELPPERIFELTPDLEAGANDMRMLLQNRQKVPKGLFCENDVLAVAAMRALNDAGLRVPEDVKIIGVENSTLSQVSEPALTSIQISRESMAVYALRLLLDQPDSMSVKPVHIRIGVQALERASSKA